jgi:DNA-binding winged helix-turn-helix (wHTH) protein/tetratricopeptide (TPR) repeat protein
MKGLRGQLAGGAMYESTQDATWMHGIDLAREPDFHLGSLRVRPARCEVESNGASQFLQRRVMQVFVALAQARGSVVTRDDLVMRCWRGLAVSDDAIFRCISMLRKLSAGYADAPYTIETVPCVGYRLTSSSLVEADPPVDAAATNDDRFRFRKLAAAAALLVLVMAGAWFWIFRDRAPDQRPLLVAVEPFEVLSNSGGVRALARRIPNEVVDALGDSQVETVLAGEPAGTTSRAPGLIVRGILRDDARTTSVDVRIEDGATRNALWSTEFKRDSQQASDLPVEVAARVTDMVNMVGFARSANPPLTDNAALSALLETSDMIREARDGTWAQMIDRAQRVVASDPKFAFGHSVLAAAYAEAAENVDVPDRAQAMTAAARREINLTLKLDPQDAGAYGILSGLEFARRPYNYRPAEAVLLRGIKFAKHPKEPLGALYQYEGVVLESVGRLREALSYQLIAQAKDEWSPSKMIRLALDYANMGNLPAARGALQKAVQRWPNHPSVKAARLYIAGFYEPPADALAIINATQAQTSTDDEQTAVWQSFVEARAARSKQVTAATAQRIREAADQGKLTRENQILMLAALGETQQAIEAANLALNHQQLQPRFLFTPVMRSARQYPGFVGLADRMGLITYWRETGNLPDFCTDRATQNECSPQLRATLKR